MKNCQFANALSFEIQFGCFFFRCLNVFTSCGRSPPSSCFSLSPFKADLTLSPIAPSSRRPSAVRVRRLLLCRAQSAELLVTQWGENKEAGWEWDATSAGSIPTPKNSESILFGFFCQGIVKQNRFFTIKNHDTRFAVIGQLLNTRCDLQTDVSP